MKRRIFLGLSTLGLACGWVGVMAPDRQSLRQGKHRLRTAGQVAMNAWLKLNTDGYVDLLMSKAEMGQGVHTALAMLVAEEMDLPLNRIRLEDARIDRVYGNVAALAEGVPFRPDNQQGLVQSVRWLMRRVMNSMGIMMTGGSSSVKDLWLPLREAAALTRQSMLETLARHWQVPADAIRVHAGEFHASKADKNLHLPFGQVVGLLLEAPVLAKQFNLKATKDFSTVGQATHRRDSFAKVNGTAQYGIDVRLPGQMFAALLLAPRFGARLISWDETLVQGMGVRKIVPLIPMHGAASGLALVAQSYWQARRAAQALSPSVTWSEGSRLNSADLSKAQSQALDKGGGFVFWGAGDAASALAGSSKKISAEYQVPFLAHATMEPMNCTVHYDGKQAQVHLGTQVPGLVQAAVAKVLALHKDKVEVQQYYLGGGFGRRLEVDHAAQAAQIALALPGVPVQLIWSREEDMRHDFYRPSALVRLQAGLDKEGNLAAWQVMSTGSAIVPAYMPRAVGMPLLGPDKTTAEGLFDTAYGIAHTQVSHTVVDSPVPVGFWRSVGHSHNAFIKESFMDECAHAAGKDPLAYRMHLLQDRPRERAVLQLVADKAGWGKTLPPGRAQGIALHESFGSVVAQVVEASISEGRIKVHQVFTAIDCGLAVNPAGIRQQVEGSVVFALTAALYGRIDIDEGSVRQSNFHDYPLLRLSEMPVVDTFIVPSEQAPEGVGEPAVPPVAPALANALFRLHGQRQRQLPLRASI